MNDLITLNILAELGADNEPPKEFRLFPLGKFSTDFGEFTFDEQSAETVLSAYRNKGIDLSADYEHAALQDPPPPEGAPASCWYNIELRADGLWATNIRWTPRATAYLKNKEYRFFSPAFRHDPTTRRVKKLVNFALTNLPATDNLAPLVAAKERPLEAEPETQPMKTLLAALALKETATEAEALAALSARTHSHEEFEREIITLTGAKSLSEAKGLLQALKAKAGRFDASEAELVALKAKETEREVETLVADGVREGKIAPAMKPFWLEQGKKDLATLKAFLAAAPKIVTTPSDAKVPPAGEGEHVVVLTAEDRLAIQTTGVSEEAFKKHKAARLKSQQA